jgi:hypothetical protein
MFTAIAQMRDKTKLPRFKANANILLDRGIVFSHIMKAQSKSIPTKSALDIWPLVLQPSKLNKLHVGNGRNEITSISTDGDFANVKITSQHFLPDTLLHFQDNIRLIRRLIQKNGHFVVF